MLEVTYKISLYKGKPPARWNINKNKAKITLYISNIWKELNSFDKFMEGLIYSILSERICVERAYNKIRIKGGRCNPCCITNVAFEMWKFL